MNSDKFKSICVSIETYNKVREISDTCFAMPVSMAKTTEYLIGKAHKKWVNDGSKKFEYNPYPDFKE